ncbi:MAG: BrnT family toxin [Candidatus Sumerlaeota bacterium]|nr:BrnT family toxin [Candidatus Sumerlaeota bacterium]
MIESQFEWDEEKAQLNLKKHKVSFDEGVTVFHDLLVATMEDPDHSGDEYRYIAIGQSVMGRILLVSFTERPYRTRIISCRKATLLERKLYEESFL